MKVVMKKFLLASGLALAFIALPQQQASAWYKFNFGVGLNIGWESANNSYGCGRWISGPPPYAFVPPPAAFPVFGYPAPVYGGDGHYAAAPAAPVASTPAVAQTRSQGPVQQANYTWGQTGYAQPNYYQPSYSGYGYGYSVPSYWYGY
jgi:hypothetical protein